MSIYSSKKEALTQSFEKRYAALDAPRPSGIGFGKTPADRDRASIAALEKQMAAPPRTGPFVSGANKILTSGFPLGSRKQGPNDGFAEWALDRRQFAKELAQSDADYQTALEQKKSKRKPAVSAQLSSVAASDNTSRRYLQPA